MHDAYFRWLVSLLGDEYLENNYSNLLHRLFEKEFRWSIEYDENRAADGIGLRKLFAKEYKNLPKNADFWPFLACSVLEMLISLAKRCEDELIYNPDRGDQTGRIFWIMIENLGLDVYDDYCFYPEEVDEILDTFMERNYEPGGSGNVFQLRNCDCRKMDLWLQLNYYLRDHFYEFWSV